MTQIQRYCRLIIDIYMHTPYIYIYVCVYGCLFSGYRILKKRKEDLCFLTGKGRDISASPLHPVF